MDLNDDLNRDNQKKESEISELSQELLQTKCNMYLQPILCKWKIMYYLSKYWLLNASIVVLGGKLLFDKISGILEKRQSFVISVFLIIILFSQILFNQISFKVAPNIGLHLLQKSFDAFEQSISDNDKKYKKDIIALAKKSKYFSQINTIQISKKDKKCKL